MTQSELNTLLAELAQTLRGLGVPISGRIAPQVQVNTRAKRRLGCCYVRSDGRCVIEVSASLLEQEDKLRETLCHELLHTCPGCRNHGELWKAYAAIVNGALGMDIRRVAQPAEEGDTAPLRQELPRYVLQCQLCGRQFPRSRRSKAVKQPWRYRCPCGGKLKRIQ